MSCLLFLAWAALGQAPAPPANDDPARTFFAGAPIVQVRIALDAAATQQLRDKPREYAAASLQLDGRTIEKVGIKLKGAAGSFRELDQGPGFTVHLGKYGGDQRLHGLSRFHLNNGAQDDSRLCEWLGQEIFSAAGLPAPRVAWAHVHLGDRDLGVYVLREGYDRQFLRRAFGSTAGNLYDGGFCQDVDAELEKDSGDGPDDRSDLRRLFELCRVVDAGRATALESAIDVPRFVDFAAVEAMLGHWDGYCLNRNNFRLWLPIGGRALFLPHGMDQLFGDAEASVLDHPPGIVASAVHQQPAFRKRYRDRVRALLPLFVPSRLKPKLEAVAARLQREFETIGPDQKRAHADAVRSLIERIEARHRHLEREARAAEPKPLSLAIGKTLALKKWHPAAETDQIELAKKDYRGVTTLSVQCLAGGAAPRHGLWRTRLLLGKGRYQLRATARCEGLQPTPPAGERDGGGALLVAHGGESARLTDNHNWQALTCEFEVAEFQHDVELMLEVRALAGRAWFRLDTLQLMRLPD